MLKKILQDIDSELSALEAEAESYMDIYWIWFSEQCKHAWSAKNRGEDVKPGRLGPVIERKTSGDSKKTYLRWKSFGGEFIRRVNKSASVGISPTATADYTKVIQLKGTWEVKKALELESNLIPLRLAIEGLHEAKVKIKAAARKINRVTKGTSR